MENGWYRLIDAMYGTANGFNQSQLTTFNANNLSMEILMLNASHTAEDLIVGLEESLTLHAHI